MSSGNKALMEQKYANYREKMGRLTKAMKNGFYLEAVAIEYAIIEDRLGSILWHSGNWRPRLDRPVSLYRKVKLVEKLAEKKNGLPQKYFSAELPQSILQWKEDRNDLMHKLMKQRLHTEDLRSPAESGQAIAKTLCSKRYPIVGRWNAVDLDRRKSDPMILTVGRERG